jgi:AraC-like DNA-binding protein
LDIALECGFHNTVNFNKIFKKYTNLAPSAFRR